MEMRPFEKSTWEKRKEKRKQAKAEKKKKRVESWTQHQHQKSTKLKKKTKIVEERIETEEKTLSPENEKEEVKVKKEKKKKNLKRKLATNFSEYLEMEMQMDKTAEEDLKMERRLAKKLGLKKKKGKLGGFDEMDMLIGEAPNDEDEDEEKSVKEESLKKKRKKRKASIEEGINEAEEGKEDEQTEVIADGAEEVGPKESCSTKAELADKVKYIAPHLRSSMRNESEENTQIRRRVRGLLNKLSESNVESITVEMSAIYKSIARSSASQIMSEEVLSSCSEGPRGNEQYAAVFAAFVAGLACSVGNDFSAKLLASVAKSFEDEYMKEDNLSLRNLTLLLSYLCIFGVCSSDLIYDFLNILSKRLMEIDVSTILTILQCCGMKLRGDDPSAMKDFILSVQNRVNELKSSSGSMPDEQLNISNKRMEFMLETIFDIKNNKKKSKEDPAHHTRLKKWLQKLKVEDILLRGLKWSKLLDPNKKGQWWLSGDVNSRTEGVEEVANSIDKEVLEAQKLLQLAATQRMNTDARRAIFCIIMSGEDYVDAFEKILRLDLAGKQDREVMRVLLECCLQEKVFNKYYSILASKFCSHDKNYKFTLQYCLWDHYKMLESMELLRSMNLARFTAEMLVSFSLSLAVLKTTDLGDLKQLTPKRIIHFRMLFEAIFEHPEATIWNIFTRVAVLPELEILRNGLEFFIKQYVTNANASLSRKFKIAKKALNNVEGILAGDIQNASY